MSDDLAGTMAAVVGTLAVLLLVAAPFAVLFVLQQAGLWPALAVAAAGLLALLVLGGLALLCRIEAHLARLARAVDEA